MQILNQPITASEINHQTLNLKNDKKVYDQNEDSDSMHATVMKESLAIINKQLLTMINYWKNAADITPNINVRALMPVKKYKKSPEKIKSYKPSSVENVTWKIYQSIINHKIQKCLTNMNISSNSQYAGKKGTGAEVCVIVLTKTIYKQYINHNPVELATFDSRDAHDAQYNLII